MVLGLADPVISISAIEWIVAVLLVPGVGALLVLAYRSGTLVKMLEVIGVELGEMKRQDREHTKRLERHDSRLTVLETREGLRVPQRIDDEPSGPR